MSGFDQFNAVVSFVIAIVTFFWIGMRSDWSQFWTKYRATGGKAEAGRVIAAYLAPYLIVALCMIYLLYAAWGSRPQVMFHTLRTLEIGEELVDLSVQRIIPVHATDEHARVTISGGFYGPELEQMQRYFGQENPIQVYAIVEEQSRPGTEQLLWIQANEGAVLDESGNYSVLAYLGGTGVDSAKTGDMYSIRIMIPEEPSQHFTRRAVYNGVSSLPAALYLSAPMHVRVERDDSAG